MGDFFSFAPANAEPYRSADLRIGRAQGVFLRRWNLECSKFFLVPPSPFAPANAEIGAPVPLRPGRAQGVFPNLPTLGKVVFQASERRKIGVWTCDMKLAADISLYPLHQDYIPPIDAIIARFEAYSEIEVRRNALSTQLFGEYDAVMRVIHTEMARSFKENKAVMVVKFVCTERGN